jgi:23S rRNA pseudouridine1911/1915/1917 synthase
LGQERVWEEAAFTPNNLPIEGGGGNTIIGAMDDRHRSCVWESGDGAGRVDKVLAEKLGMSRTRLQALWAAGALRCAGRVLAAGERPAAGDRVEVEIPPPVPAEVAPEALELSVIYEDGDLIAVDKAPGMVVHPGAGHARGTLVGALLHHCAGQLSGIGGVERPGIVHRLDRETSGVIVAAKHDQAHQALARQFKNRTMRKTYLAFVCGTPRGAAGTWDGPVRRHPLHRQKMAVGPGGREARTDYLVRQGWNQASLLELTLHTGRTHQIRVHATHAGHPVVGDTLYGRARPWPPEAGVGRQLLHAWKLVLVHPRTQKALALEAPMPHDFQQFQRWLS